MELMLLSWTSIGAVGNLLCLSATLSQLGALVLCQALAQVGGRGAHPKARIAA